MDAQFTLLVLSIMVLVMGSAIVGYKSFKDRYFLSKLGKQKQLLFMSLPIMIYVILFTYVPLWG